MKSGFYKSNNLIIEYTDPLSFYYEYKDIFINQIYNFNSENDKPFIIDAGGCIGVSVLYFKLHYPKSKILVFEPDNSLYSVLKRNIVQNKLKDIELIKAGLGKNEGKYKFYSDGLDGGSINDINGSSTLVEVDIVRLSKYLTQPVDLLKMNIEGLESEVFEEIEDKLYFFKEIIFEYHCFNNLPQSLGNILNILDRNGFRYVVTDATNAKVPIPFSLPSDYKYFNLVYAKKL